MAPLFVKYKIKEMCTFERRGQRKGEKERREWAQTELSDKHENERQIEGRTKKKLSFPVCFFASDITSAPLRRETYQFFSLKPYIVELKGTASLAAMSRSKQWF